MDPVVVAADHPAAAHAARASLYTRAVRRFANVVEVCGNLNITSHVYYVEIKY